MTPVQCRALLVAGRVGDWQTCHRLVGPLAASAPVAVAVALRGLDIEGRSHALVLEPRFDDSIVVVNAAARSVSAYPISTHPFGPKLTGHLQSVKTPDQSTMLVQPGRYEAHPCRITTGRTLPVDAGAGLAAFYLRLNPSRSIPCFYDHDQDGSIGWRDEFASHHHGSSVPASVTVAIYPEHPKTRPHAGCQVLRPQDWPAFVRAVGGERASFHYVIERATPAGGPSAGQRS